MAMHTGENEQGLRKILDMTRMISILLLGLHFYYYCYGAFHAMGWSAALSDRLLLNIQNTGLFSSFMKSKSLSLAFLAISLLGTRGRKDEKLSHKTAIAYLATGLLLYFLSGFILMINALGVTELAITYGSV